MKVILNRLPGLKDMGYTPNYIIGDQLSREGIIGNSLNYRVNEGIGYWESKLNKSKAIGFDNQMSYNSRITGYRHKRDFEKEVIDYEEKRFAYYSSILGSSRAMDWVRYEELPVSDRILIRAPIVGSMIMCGLLNPNDETELIEDSVKIGFGGFSIYGETDGYYGSINPRFVWRYISESEKSELDRLGLYAEITRHKYLTQQINDSGQVLKIFDRGANQFNHSFAGEGGWTVIRCVATDGTCIDINCVTSVRYHLSNIYNPITGELLKSELKSVEIYQPERSECIKIKGFNLTIHSITFNNRAKSVEKFVITDVFLNKNMGYFGVGLDATMTYLGSGNGKDKDIVRKLKYHFVARIETVVEYLKTGVKIENYDVWRDIIKKSGL